MLLPTIIRSFACLFFVLALTSCGGGGGGGGDGGGKAGGGGGPQDNSNKIGLNTFQNGGDALSTPQGRLSAAMVNGDSSVLKAEDADMVSSQAYANYQSQLEKQNA